MAMRTLIIILVLLCVAVIAVLGTLAFALLWFISPSTAPARPAKPAADPAKPAADPAKTTQTRFVSTVPASVSGKDDLDHAPVAAEVAEVPIFWHKPEPDVTETDPHPVAVVECTGPLVHPGRISRQPTELPAPAGLELELAGYPRTSGSTSAEPLGVWTACRLLERSCYWPGRRLAERHLLPQGEDATAADGTRRRQPDRKLYGRLKHNGTHGSYELLIDGEADLIYECRRPSADERVLLAEREIELEIQAVALDAFVFLRNRENPVTGLTLSQVRDIYTRTAGGHGRIRSWRPVGGSDISIRPFVRNRNSGSQETLRSLVMNGRPVVAGESLIGHTMAGPFNLMGSAKGGIGFTFFHYHRYMAPRGFAGKEAEPSIRLFAIDGVVPSRASIIDRSYPLVTEVYAVLRADLPAEHPARRLRDWLVTAEGQAVVAETGYVSVLSRPADG